MEYRRIGRQATGFDGGGGSGADVPVVLSATAAHYSGGGGCRGCDRVTSTTAVATVFAVEIPFVVADLAR